MNCHITIHNPKSQISIRGKWEALKQFLPIHSESVPDHLCIRDNFRRIEITVTPEAPVEAKLGVDLARQYLAELSEQNSEGTIRIGKNELSKLIRELENAGRSI